MSTDLLCSLDVGETHSIGSSVWGMKSPESPNQVCDEDLSFFLLLCFHTNDKKNQKQVREVHCTLLG